MVRVLLLVSALLAFAPAAHGAVAKEYGEAAAAIRATTYELGFPEAWRARASRRYTPSLGRYAIGSATTVRSHLMALEHAGIDAAFAGWDGRATKARRLRALLQATHDGDREVRWAARIEAEARGAPRARRVADQLNSVGREVARHPAYLRVGGRPVVVVDTSARDSCRTVEKWVRVNGGWSHLVVQAVPRAARCRVQPAGWYARPAAGRLTTAPGAATAAPPAGRSSRDVSRFRGALRRLYRSGARWQVVDGFNAWRRGNPLESAAEWRSRTGYGLLLDAVRDPASAPAAAGAGTVLVAAAGDIACDPKSSAFEDGAGRDLYCRQAATADLAESADAVLTLGDNQYDDGSLAQYRASFDRSWGRLRPKLWAAVGNHEYHTPGAAGHFDYFNGQGVHDGRAGPRGKGYFGLELGEWSVIALNTNCSKVSCDAGSEQLTWLKQRLASHPRRCTLAFMHHPRFSSGDHGGSDRIAAIWELLHRNGVDVVLAGHDHDYERFGPQDPGGRLDLQAGIRSFVVGTGGKDVRPFKAAVANSEARIADTYGVLRLELRPEGYGWRFLGAGGALRDSGDERCR